MFLFVVSISSNAQTKILFDATKAESAGNADWVIDADVHNLGFFSGGVSLGGNESNPQKIPTPLQSNITPSTPETYWNGGLSNWAIDCVKQGYVVESLPYNGQITYGNAANLQDLSHYKVFVVDEPNILFTASEKTAIITFVQNGGGLCIISDHTISDRNNDGYDSPQILNDLMSNNTIQNNAFGISFNYTDISQTSTNIANLPTNPILHGAAGNVTRVQWSSGTTMTLNPVQNSSVTGLVYTTGSATTGNSNAMCASATYMNGKVLAIGDSSIPDDGTGDSNDVLYNGYTGDASGNHQKLLMNSIIWLATNTLGVATANTDASKFNITPNPIHNKQLAFTVRDNGLPFEVAVYDLSGRKLKTVMLEKGGSNIISVSELPAGMYLCKIANANGFESRRFIVE